MGKNTFQGIEPGFAHTGGQAEDSGFQNAADTVLLPGRLLNGGLHPAAAAVIQNGKGKAVQPFQLRRKVFRAEGKIVNARAAGDMGAQQDAPVLQGMDENGAGSHQRGRDAPAEVSAAPVILKTAVFGKAGEVSVAGPGGPPPVIPAAGVRVGNQDGQGRAGSPALKKATDDAERILFPAGRGDGAGRAAQGQAGGNEGLIHRQAGSQAVQDGADFRTVAFPEEGKGDTGAKGIFHDQSPK